MPSAQRGCGARRACARFAREAKGAHERENHDDDQDDANDAYAAVAVSVAVAPKGEDAAAPQAAEQEQEKDDDKDESFISDTAGSYGLRNAIIRFAREAKDP